MVILFHGKLLAIGQQNNMWPMFSFGFATMVVVIQIYGLNLKKWQLPSIQIVYILAVELLFGGFTGHRTIGDVRQVL